MMSGLAAKNAENAKIVREYFCTIERIEGLEQVARSWLGTPFLCNSNTRGPRGGVSCQKLVAEIYRETGACDIQVPEVPMSLANFSRGEGLLMGFMEGIGDRFVMVPDHTRDVLPGDLLGFRLGRTVHHCGIALPGGRFVHAITRLGTTYGQLTDPTWGSRLEIAWRPIESGPEGPS
jgi:cell wall-associated NlpC family hydrolase